MDNSFSIDSRKIIFFINFYFFTGTKALTNMSEQFSKLNKFGHTIAGKKSTDSPLKSEFNAEKKKPLDAKAGAKPLFTVGNRDIEGNRKSRSNSGSSTSSHEFNEMRRGSHELEDSFVSSNLERVENIGNSENFNNLIDKERSQDRSFGVLNFLQPSDADKSSSTGQIDRAGATTPEITIQGVGDSVNSEEKEKAIPPSSLNLPKNISHSTGEVDNRVPGRLGEDIRAQADDAKLHEKKRSNSEQDLASNITSSQSESALKSIKNNVASVASPVATTAKEILSPFSKFAKGVQSFGANLDPRKLKSAGQVGMTRNLSDHHLDQRQKLQERWSNCKSHLIAL